MGDAGVGTYVNRCLRLHLEGSFTWHTDNAVCNARYTTSLTLSLSELLVGSHAAVTGRC